MNEDFKSILMEMPKSIMIYDKQTKKVHMVNNECQTLLGLSNFQEDQKDDEILASKIFSLFDNKDAQDLTIKNS